MASFADVEYCIYKWVCQKKSNNMLTYYRDGPWTLQFNIKSPSLKRVSCGQPYSKIVPPILMKLQKETIS